MPGTVDYANGIDDLWPYHAALMAGGIACFLGAAGIVQFGRKTRWWYKVHPVVAISGGILSIAAISVAFIMVSNSEAPHLQYLHGWIGVSTVAIIIITPLFMLFRERISNRIKKFNVYHKMFGFAVIVLMFVNIINGLVMMHVI